jgi:hypothetical protein
MASLSQNGETGPEGRIVSRRKGGDHTGELMAGLEIVVRRA